ncbi:metal-dependent hydrolase family protein [Methanobacterium aggregans]|uniref:metal-dependent hydrolase family protein n=1 Tax=Methanobacterium aggregans TaxID=1615586 RepID=UPI001AEA88FD|nr:amidohydrolase family protein [Methanobacterium aggregans]MBP2046104.1 imidazolonepropionase-like amidohydrolase [Methanobacterium aggregans]
MTWTLIKNGTLIDGTGADPIENAAILIKDNMIQVVGPENSVKIPKGTGVVDAYGGFIMPGFIDTHLHVMANGFNREDTIYDPLSFYFYRAVENLRLTLNAGVTSVRDAGLADAGVKMAIEKGIIKGPRIQLCITPLSITGGHFDFWLKSGYDVKVSYPGYPDSICDGTEEVRKKVREVLRAGAEVVKVMVTGGVMSVNDGPESAQFTPDELKVVVEEAQFKDNIKVMAHAHGVQGIKNAVEAGIHSIEHGTYLNDESIHMMLEGGTFLVPTLMVNKNLKELALQGKTREWETEAALKVFDIQKENVKKAYTAGVPLAMGTDCGVVEHGTNLKELALLCEIGMDPMEAIVAGTKRGAECLGWDHKLGTVEEGKFADIVISRIDPLLDIEALGDPENIVTVIKNGEIVKDNLDQK